MSETSKPTMSREQALTRIQEVAEWADENGWQIVASDLHEAHRAISEDKPQAPPKDPSNVVHVTGWWRSGLWRQRQ